MGTFSGDTSALIALEKRLRGVASTGASRVAKAAASAVQQQIDNGFRDGVSPYGETWAPKSPLSKPGPTLVGQSMSGAVTVGADGLNVKATIGSPYAHVHQDGATIVPKRAPALSWIGGSGRVFAKKVTIPARPMLPGEAALPSRWEDAMAKAAGDALGKALK